MTFFRLCLCAAVLSFGHCSHSRAPEPEEFKLSAETLSKQYPAWRETGWARVYAGKILITQDEEGRKTYLASGGALLVTGTSSPIWALAPSISVFSDSAEAFGKATVKKGDRLYLGKDESTKIRIQGTEIKPEGPHVVSGIAQTESEPPAGTGSPETVDLTLAMTPTFGAAPASAPAPLPPPPSEPVKAKPARVKQPKATSSHPAQPSGKVVKANSPPIPPMPKTKEPPAIDRSKLLNLLREPAER